MPMLGCTRRAYGTESKLSYLGHALVENRNGLIAPRWSPRRMDSPSATPLY